MSFRDESKTSVTLIDRVAAGPADDAAWHQFVERYGPMSMLKNEVSRLERNFGATSGVE
jgi:hypothetical protein